MGGQAGQTISWTALRASEESGKKRSREKAFFDGNVCDSAMRRYLRCQSRSLVEITREQFSLMEEDAKIKWRNAYERDKHLKTCEDAATKLEPMLKRYVIGRNFAVGQRFSVDVEIDGTLTTLVGEIDLYVVNEDSSITLYDLKITTNNRYWRKTMAQLVMYALAMELSGYIVSGAYLLQPLCAKKFLQVDLGAQARNELVSSLGRFTEHE